MDSGESGSQTAIRELWEDTGLKDLQLLGTHQALNNVGGEIHYEVLRAVQNDEPKMVEAERQQIFYWLEPSAISLDDFYRADIEFIEHHLSRFASQIRQSHHHHLYSSFVSRRKHDKRPSANVSDSQFVLVLLSKNKSGGRV